MEDQAMAERDGWFDKQGLDLDDRIAIRETETWKKYFEDEKITSEELDTQQKLIFDRLKAIEADLDDKTHAAITGVLLEYGVLIEMYRASLGILAEATGTMEAAK
jgi:hypothetical protein